MRSESQYYRIIPEKSDIEHGWHYVACPLCQADSPEIYIEAGDYLNHISGRFCATKCRKCGFIYTNPRPFGNELGRFYPDSTGYYQPDMEDGDVLPKKSYPMLERYLGYGEDGVKKPFSEKADRVYRKGIPHFVPDGRLLEVGCSYGKFLKQMKDWGWDVEGIELNARAAEYAEKELDLPVHRGVIEDVSLQENKYDCVVMRMVLEHVASPLDVLCAIGRSMKPGGELVITVPNIACPEVKYFGEYSYFLQLPTHLSHFSPDSLSQALNKAGYKVMAQYFVANRNDIIESARIRAREQGGDWISRLVGKRWFENLVLKNVMRLERGMKISPRMVFYAEKAL